MRNSIIETIDAERQALSARMQLLASASSELQRGGLCGYSFGFTYGEDFCLDDSPELSLRIGNIVSMQWQQHQKK